MFNVNVVVCFLLTEIVRLRRWVTCLADHDERKKLDLHIERRATILDV